MRLSRAFTLIELLVVITIVIALLAIALPSMQRALTFASSAVCVSNTRQLQQAWYAYGMDHMGQVMPWRVGSNRLWHDPISPYVDDIDAVRYCPETEYNPNTGNGSYGFGNARLWWWDTGANGLETGSYGYNGFLYHRSRSGDWFFPAAAPFKTADEAAWFNTINPSMAASVPVFFDCRFVDTWPHHDNPLPGVPRPYNNGDLMNRVYTVHDRHAGLGINTAFADGHAETIPTRMLWNLKWNAMFELQGEVAHEF